jgi:CubicO group peptidase (beta-lactamase class C family)/D-alanyl-D-alanine dipeptidase
MVSQSWGARGVRRGARVLILAGGVAGVPLGAQGRDVVGPLPRYTAVVQALTTFIEAEMRDKGIPALSIALVDSNRVVWSRGFGVTNARTGAPATANTVYRVGSVSKLFTDIGIMQLVERGQLDIDAPVQRYLPSFSPTNRSGKPITLRQLMSHNSGLVREPPVGHYFDDTRPTLAATVASLSGTALVYPPEITFKYSNAAIATVGAILERQGRAPFAALLERQVLAPMGLTSTSFEPSAALLARVPDAVMWNYHERPFAAPTFPLGMAPAGSMYSSMPDLGRFISMLFAGGMGVNGRVLRTPTLQAMWTPQFSPAGATRGVGLGFILNTFEGKRVVAHGGAIYGFATQLSALPDERLGVAVSAAKDGANALTTRIANEALRLMLLLRKREPIPAIRLSAAVPLALATRLAGTYVADGREVEITRRDSTVFVTATGVDHRLRMRTWAGDTLIADDALAFGATLWGDGQTLHFGSRRYTRSAPETGLPAAPPERWRGLIGEYGWDYNVLYVRERAGRLHALIEWFFDYPLSEVSENVYAFPGYGLYAGERIEFTRDASGRATRATAAGIPFVRRSWVGEDGGVFRITPVQPVETLRAAALAASPPVEQGTFRASDLVELVSLDSTIRLDIRYATDRNFLSAPMYTQARAFLQRPAAEALLRAHRALAAQGYGLLIHDGYRPWYVTKMFWDGTPPEKHGFVADPASGSRHNRGCAVDLTMYDLRTGEPVVTTGGYDEMSDRSYPEYPGGTSRQRALREILRAAMEAEGFSVFSAEWWHFDYKDWRQYRIGNQRFEDLQP